MNYRNIQPIDVWSPQGQRTCTKFMLTDFYGYHFDNGSGNVNYWLLGSQDEQYYDGVLEIPSPIIQNWGASDDIIFNYVAQQLGLVIIP